MRPLPIRVTILVGCIQGFPDCLSIHICMHIKQDKHLYVVVVVVVFVSRSIKYAHPF